ncbi:MAG: menaquinone biosynthesis decarboxylase [Phycisphaerae bacterium]
MPYTSLRDFLQALESAGELRRIKAEVDPILEVTEIADRVSKAPDPAGYYAGSQRAPFYAQQPLHGTAAVNQALLFERIKGSALPLAINSYGSYKRMHMALGCESFDELASRISELTKPELPIGLMNKIKKGYDLLKLGSYVPKVRFGPAPCQEVVHTDKPDLNMLPIIQCWPEDGGRYITFGQIVTRHPETGARNLGMYRVQVFDHQTTAMHWHPHHDGARHFRAYARQGKPCPLAISLGGESVLPYAATAPLPPGIDEHMFAGFLQGRGIDLVACKTVPLEVPANAEIIIEGYVDPRQTILEGPFGDHTGFYSLADQFPVFRVTAITHRRDPIYPTTIVGKPPQEDYYLGKATERLFLPLLKILVPDILDYDLPMFGVFHSCVFVKIRKEYAYHARKVMHAIWGAGQMAWTKMIVVVDEHVDVHNIDDVMFHVAANVDPRRDVVITEGPLDILDHAAPAMGAGSKMGIDATKKWPGEGTVRDWPNEITMDQKTVDLVTRRWHEYGF